ncbi:hypothetical protein SAY87_018835 [Trapa incisa]|uniref:TIR domain-containing protein n=1 Tax=Trapa incisa TaxID=236973 RepID=A0AAN7Q1S7_9MYRT|nr:hypothetical protein SAY87_018835 [Trapa incisa]
MESDAGCWVSWWASLCFSFISIFVSVISGFVVRKMKRAAPSATMTSNDAVSQVTSCTGIMDTPYSSSVSSQLGYEYDVFLSFHGGDTRKGFADSLYTSLEDAGIRVFRDKERLPFGEKIGTQLLQGIKNSSLSIPILSENYASSKWCLKELAFMMECREASARKHMVLPVFYDVTPNEVQHQTGGYSRAFQQHTKEQDLEVVQKWRKALAEVGSLKGWEAKNEADGYQGRLIKMIVTKVLTELKTKVHLSVSDNLVGVCDKVEQVMKMLDLKVPDVRFVGIWGMGGIGKTTLAKYIYNNILDDFDSCCFLPDIRETLSCSHSSTQQLQSQLVGGLLGWSRPNFATIDEGIYYLKGRLGARKVLILLDDVDHIDQLKALAAKTDWFGKGSRIIITTRNKDVLKAVQEHHIYQVKEMEEVCALQLFCKHALWRDAPTIKLRALSEKIAKRTGGLPLALEVIGSFLHGKGEQVWKATSKKLKKVPHKDVHQKLVISYNALEHHQKQMFLDIACILIGENITAASYFWKDRFDFSVEADIEVLQLLSLIKVGEEDRLGMHDQLRDVGREIVRRENYDEPGERSRLWGKDALDVLINNQGSRCLEAIRLDHHDGLEVYCFSAEMFSKLPKLRFLHLDCANMVGNFKHHLPELRWLRWRISPFNCRATNLNLKKLLILDLSDSQFTHEWNLLNTVQLMAVKLKVLDLSDSKELKRAPDLSAFCNLKSLNLRNCENLEEVDPSVGKLVHLTYLDVAGCHYIKELPKLDGLKMLKILNGSNCYSLTKIRGSVSHLTSLTDLMLDYSKVRELTESVGGLVTLRRLSLVGTPLKELPKSIGGLKSLVVLAISKTKISILPDSMGSLFNLEVLRIDRSSVLRLPDALGQLKNLERIDASGCRNLEEISSLKGLSSLRVLDLRHTNITCIPETIMGLSCLELLDVAWCSRLQKVPALPSSLRRMSMTSQLAPIPNTTEMTNLKELEFIKCIVPEEVYELPKLERLSICRSNASILLGQIDGFRMLKELLIANIDLQCLPRLPSSLNKLCILRCHLLERMKELSNLQSLSELWIHGCPELVDVEGLGDLVSLRKLHVAFCSRIAKLDGLEMLVSLEDLDFRFCDNLESLADLSKLKALHSLSVYHAPIGTLSGLSYLNSLRTLGVKGSARLQRLDGLEVLEHLEKLFLGSNNAIESLPNLSNLRSLNCLSVASGCDKLQGFEGLEFCEKLKNIFISGCKAIKRLPDLSNLTSLESLVVRDCENLQGLEGLDRLGKLEWLRMKGCKSIENFPDLSNLTSLKYFDTDLSENLPEVQRLKESIQPWPPEWWKSVEWEQYLKPHCVEKIQELDGLKFDDTNRFHAILRNSRRMSTMNMKSLEETNLGLLRRWYTDGCDGIPELEGLENLERSHLRVIVEPQFLALDRLDSDFFF